MKIKVGTLRKDVTAFGNKYWIQIEDTRLDGNSDLEKFVNEEVSVIIDDMKAIHEIVRRQDEAE